MQTCIFFTVRDSLKANTNVCNFFYNAFRHDVQLNCGIDFSLGKVKGDGKIGQPGKCTLFCFFCIATWDTPKILWVIIQGYT